MIKSIIMKEIKPDILTCWSPDAKNYIPILLMHSLLFAAEIYDAGDTVILDRYNFRSLALVEKFFPDKIGLPVFIGERNESDLYADKHN